MAHVLAISCFVVGFVTMYTSLVVWTAVMFPRAVQRARQRLEAGLTGSLLCGLVCCAAAAVFGGVLLMLRMPCVAAVSGIMDWLSSLLSFRRFAHDDYMIAHAIGWVLMAPLLVAWACGGAAFAELFASRVHKRVGRDMPIRSLAGGAFCMSAAAFLPLLGWYFFLPAISLMSIGAGALALLPGKLRVGQSERASAAIEERELPACAPSTVGAR